MEHEARIDRSFSKKERLNSKKRIEELFKKGSSFYLHPLQLRFLKTTMQGNNQVLISVPKKYQRRAVDRNRTKRLIREAYRNNKHHLIGLETTFDLGIVYLSPEICSFKEVQEKLVLLLERLSKTSSNLKIAK